MSYATCMLHSSCNMIQLYDAKKVEKKFFLHHDVA